MTPSTPPSPPHSSARPDSPRAPVLISLPDGLSVSGVTLWAVRLGTLLAARGHAVTLMCHDEPAGQRTLPIPIPPGVEVRRLTGLPPLREGDVSRHIPVYRREMDMLRRRSPAPVVYLPTLLGDSFAIGAAMALTDPESIRIVGWRHADTAYDLRVCVHYEPALASLVGVSRRIVDSLSEALAWRRHEIAHLPCAVPVGHAPPERTPLRGRALRLVYTGRIEHKQKRVGALIAMSDELDRRGVAHTLALIGDGPALEELKEAAASRAGRVRVTGALGPDDVRHELRDADCFVLPSRYEGLSVAMLEAMAEGCVPLVGESVSGAGEAIVDGLSGVLVPITPDAGEDEAGIAFADAVERFAASEARQMGAEAWRRVREEYSLERYAPRVCAIIDAAAASPARSWPASRPVSFTASGAGVTTSGTVPPDGAQRLADALRRLAGKRVVLHGAGRHTIELASILAASPATIVAIADDDPARHGRTLLGWPIINPSDAIEHGATDVVISSWIHADDIFARGSVYLNQGIRVHHLYRDEGADSTLLGAPYTTTACSN